jgi:hypothetical protein
MRQWVQIVVLQLQQWLQNVSDGAIDASGGPQSGHIDAFIGHRSGPIDTVGGSQSGPINIFSAACNTRIITSKLF